MLLTMPTYSGTLAAVRCLGKHGVPVTLAGEERLLAPARWSRYTTRWVRCPPVLRTEAFLAWLLAFGRREPGHVLVATSDDVAWLLAANAAALGEYFRMYQPPLATVVRVLDKQALHAACEAAGIATVPTWFPRSEDEVARLAREAPFPLLIKARTQVLRSPQTKGIVARSPEELLPCYRAFQERGRYLPGIERHFGDVTRPMVQTFLADAATRVYSMCGFIDRSGELFAARAAVKLLQRTQPVGLGLCFQAAPLEPELAQRVAHLCRSIGHFGVFEVEFLRDAGSYQLIDFNPRFYGQMGLEHHRALPLALLAWLAACGEQDELRQRVVTAAQAADGPATIYCNRYPFEMQLLFRRLAGRMPAAEHERWKRWYAEHRGSAVDASSDRNDRLPGVLHAAGELWAGIRALPRALSQR
jgi:predicted ATP-grasp superfamily ATP-dependent carboligase